MCDPLARLAILWGTHDVASAEHLPALGYSIPAAVITGRAHSHLLTAQRPREADPEVLNVSELGLSLRDLLDGSQTSENLGDRLPLSPPT